MLSEELHGFVSVVLDLNSPVISFVDCVSSNQVAYCDDITTPPAMSPHHSPILSTAPIIHTLEMVSMR